MKQLGEKFIASELTDKILNTETEVEKDVISSIEVFKKAVSGDEISVEPKYKERHDIKPFCKFIWATNNLPQLNVEDNGYYRRLYFLPFNKKITDEEVIKFDKSKILTREALDYLANIALREYLKIADNYKIANRKESNAIVSAYRTSLNSVEAFLENEEIIDSMFFADDRVPKTVMYGKYVGWCNERKYFIKPKKAFYTKVLSHAEYVEAQKDGIDCFRNTNKSTKENNSLSKLLDGTTDFSNSQPNHSRHIGTFSNKPFDGNPFGGKPF